MNKLFARSRDLILLGLIIITVAVVAMVSPQFMTFNNFMNILRTNSINGIMALGMMFLILTGNIDVSVGPSMMVCGGMITTMVLQRMREESPMGYVLVFALAIGTGILIGLVNGSITTYLGIPSIVVTLGMYSVLSGGISIITGGSWIINFPYWFTSMTAKRIGGVYVSIWIYLLMIILSYLLLNRLNIGRKILAYGGNRVSATRAGLSANKLSLLVFALMGTGVGIASVLLVSSNALFDPTAGAGYELEVIAIVVLGGAVLDGGRATVAGTVLATLLIGIVNNAIVLVSVPIYYQKLVMGGMILLSVVFTALQSQKKQKKRIAEQKS